MQMPHISAEVQSDRALLEALDHRLSLACVNSLEATGQLRFPTEAARKWDIAAGSGEVEMLTVGEIGVLMPVGGERQPALQTAIDEGTRVRTKRVPASTYITVPIGLRRTWDVEDERSRVEVISMPQEVLIVQEGTIAQAVDRLLPRMLRQHRERVVEDIFARDRSLIRLYAAAKLIQEAFPSIYQTPEPLLET